MTNSVKDQLAADFEKAKSAGSVRVGRIRQIFQDAFAQTVTELKQGTGEIGSIAKDSTSTLTELKNAQKPTPQEVVPVQVEIQDEGVEAPILSEPISEVAAPPTTAEEIVIEISPEQASSQQTESTTESLVDSLKASIQQVLRSLQEGEASATLQQQVVRLREQMVALDVKLSNRYGERYEGIKQGFNQDVENAKTWYAGMKTDANATGVNVLESKQAEIATKMGEAGTTIAQKEEKIKQLLKELWQTVKS